MSLWETTVSEDARNSLQTWTSVLLFAGFFYVGLLLLRDVDVPSWFVWVGLPLAALEVVLVVARWRRERRHS